MRRAWIPMAVLVACAAPAAAQEPSFEALGQAGCLWILRSRDPRLGGELNANQVLFASMDGANFFRRARPGDTLEMKLELAQLRAPLAVFTGEVFVKNERIAELEKLVLAFGKTE